MTKMKAKKKKTRDSSPTLRTIQMVEKTLKNMDNSEITLAGLKRILPKQVNHNTLKQVIDYLDKINHVYIGVRGIVYIYNPSKKMKRLIENSYEWTPEGFRKFRGKVY